MTMAFFPPFTTTSAKLSLPRTVTASALPKSASATAREVRSFMACRRAS